ncbi:WhiB family transcriptional regulator [Kitasatospora indigofera]|uniref:WhiB family transcriptional regulator n=1 Tax=Kitasatospora indigofera TaxID=67307 RepID=UPI0036387F10
MNTITQDLEKVHIFDLDRGDQSWRLDAACSRHPEPDIFFSPPRLAAHQDALELCKRCPVLLQCRDDAVECRVTDGIRGGLTADDIARLITNREDKPDFARIRAVLTGQPVPLTEPEKRAAVRIALMVGISWESWAAAFGIGYKSAARRRKRAERDLELLSQARLADEIAVADHLRAALAASTAVAA